MASETEPAKLLLPYLQRADELQKHEPLVAYYCRLYAMERGLKIPPGERTKTTNALLVSLMNQLEKDKKSLNLGPDDSLHLEGFALNVFAKADKQDHAGRADLNTAKTFYAASIFFEIISQFGPLQPDLEQKRKYSIWKAADIRKALKEGRKPQPGPPSGDEDLSVPSTTPTGANDLRDSVVSQTQSGSDSLPQVYDNVNDEHANIPQTPQVYDKMNSHTSLNTSPPARFHNEVDNQHPSNIQSYPTSGYPSHEFHPPPPRNEPDSASYSQPYHHIQPYPQEHQQQPLPHNFPPNETSPTYNYAHFQSYPSFSESSLPAAPSHYPTTYYQGSDTSYSPQVTPPPPASYPSASQYHSNGRDGTALEPQPTPAPAKSYHYDSSYEPPPEKIAEAHKAARFAVGALAFDDVSVAVDHLKKSLELLTNPLANV